MSLADAGSSSAFALRISGRLQNSISSFHKSAPLSVPTIQVGQTVVHGATKPAEGRRHGSRRIGLVVFALVAESSGYGALSGVVIVGALAIGVYAIKSR